MIAKYQIIIICDDAELSQLGCQCKSWSKWHHKTFQKSDTEHFSSKHPLYKLYKKDMNILRAEIVFQLLFPEAVYYIQCFHTFQMTSSY